MSKELPEFDTPEKEPKKRMMYCIEQTYGGPVAKCFQCRHYGDHEEGEECRTRACRHGCGPTSTRGEPPPPVKCKYECVFPSI